MNNIIKLYNDKVKSNSFAVYFTKHLKHLISPIKAKDMKLLLDANIIKKLDHIAIFKCFR